MAEAVTSGINLPHTGSIPVAWDSLLEARPRAGVASRARTRKKGEPYPTPDWAKALLILSLLVAGGGMMGLATSAALTDNQTTLVRRPGVTTPTGRAEVVKTPQPIPTPEPTTKPVGTPEMP